MGRKTAKNSLLLSATLIFIYIIIFEFILPVNRVLPKPSILLESIPHIWSEYNLLISLAHTMSIIYFAILLSFFSTFILSSRIFKLFDDMLESKYSFRFLNYIPPFIIIMLLSFWFPSGIVLIEILFIIVLTHILIYRHLFSNLKNVPEEFITVGRNLGLTKSNIFKMISWKCLEPGLIKEYSRIHYSLWGSALLFEYVFNAGGIGSVFHITASYHDFTALFLTAFIVFLLIWIGDFFIRLINNVIFGWGK